MTIPRYTLTDPPSDDAGYTTSWTVRGGDVDRHGRLRLDGIARYLQDIAWDDLHSNGFAESDPSWIVRRSTLEVLHPIRWPDRIRLQRWCSGVSTRWANMRVRITSAAGGLVETEAFWINVDEKTGTTARISEAGFAHLAKTTDEHRLRWRPELVGAPGAIDQRDKPFSLRETDIDLFGHVNNAVYWQAVEQFLPAHSDLLDRPHRAVLEYNRPIAPDTPVLVRTENRPSGLHLWFRTDDGVNAAGIVHALPPTNE